MIFGLFAKIKLVIYKIIVQAIHSFFSNRIHLVILVFVIVLITLISIFTDYFIFVKTFLILLFKYVDE